MYLVFLAQVEEETDGEEFEALFLLDIREEGQDSQIDIEGAPLS